MNFVGTFSNIAVVVVAIMIAFYGVTQGKRVIRRRNRLDELEERHERLRRQRRDLLVRSEEQ